MNTEQIIYSGAPTTQTTSVSSINNPALANNPSFAGSNGFVNNAGYGHLPSTTAHSFTVHNREERFLEKERTREVKRATKQEKTAEKMQVRADKQFVKAATKAQNHKERSAMRHEERGVKLAAAAQFHRQAAMESSSEAQRAELLSSLPPRGTLPTTAGTVTPIGYGQTGLAGSNGFQNVSGSAYPTTSSSTYI